MREDHIDPVEAAFIAEAIYWRALCAVVCLIAVAFIALAWEAGKAIFGVTS